MNNVTVVTSGKGGVGKSTVTFGLGLVLSKLGKRVLLIDGDAEIGCLDHMLGISEHKVFDISDVVSGTAEPSKAVYTCAFEPNLFLLPAPSAEEDIINPEIMKQLVSIFARFYDYVFIDSPAGVGRSFESASAAAGKALIVATPDPVSVHGANRAHKRLSAAGGCQQRLIINRFSSSAFRNEGYYGDLDSVIDDAGVRLIAVVPEDPALASATVNAVCPAQRSPGMLAIERLAARLLGRQVPLPPLRNF
ncbi:MAG TPA: septum site-determining protein MinD [Ruminococcaceae bacterium]|nr:septum site-determining protein MinD [Oscillospiraceae bacterium]